MHYYIIYLKSRRNTHTLSKFWSLSAAGSRTPQASLAVQISEHYARFRFWLHEGYKHLIRIRSISWQPWGDCEARVCGTDDAFGSDTAESEKSGKNCPLPPLHRMWRKEEAFKSWYAIYMQSSTNRLFSFQIRAQSIRGSISMHRRLQLVTILTWRVLKWGQ
jgi:hypothetical protein